MANECIPFWDPADHITVVAGAGGVTGKRFVTATGPLAVGLGTAGGVPSAVLPAANAAILGVAAQDAAAGNAVMVYCEGIVPVVAGAALTGGTPVMTDATGAAIPWVAVVGNTKAGYCLADTANGADAPIKLF
jgi:predicted RecA/RadA family phage recombinase